MSTDHKKEKPSSSQLSLLGRICDNPDRVLEEVKIIFLDMFNNGDFTLLSAVFEDVVSLFSGNISRVQSLLTHLTTTSDIPRMSFLPWHGSSTAPILREWP